MSAPVCPSCGDQSLRIANRHHHQTSVECFHSDCCWSQTPDEDLVILAALETYRRNQPKEGTK